MKKIVSLFYLFIGTLPTIGLCQLKKGYEINAHMQGVPEGALIRMSIFQDNDWKSTDDSAIVLKNGEFHISGTIPSIGPRYYILSVYKDRYIDEVYKVVRMFIANNDKISITCPNVDSINHEYIDQFCNVQGSISNYSREIELPSYFLWYQTHSRIKDYLLKLQDSIGFEPKIVDALQTADAELNQAFYYNTFDPSEPMRIPSMPWWVWFWSEYTHDSLVVEAYNNLTEAQKRTYYGIIAKEKVKLCEGQPFPDCTLPTSEGKMVSLRNDIIAKNKLTLVHFWAYNSGNRKERQDELRALYKKYHEKGFNIIGVCSDHREISYKKALTEEQFVWQNASDLKGEDGVVNSIYHEYGAERSPKISNVLVNEKGVIVAWGVYGLTLQWYLWKYFNK